MKQILKDDKGYPLNFDPSVFYKNKEIWTPLNILNSNIPEYYLISSWGRLSNGKSGNILPQNLIPERNRYIQTMIRMKNGEAVWIQMHTLVASIYIPCFIVNHKDKEYIVNHKDGIKWHNEPYNLEWVTKSENTIHADKNGLIERPNGQDNGSAKLTDDQYRQICELLQQGYYPNQVNKIMNLGIDITNIVQKIRMGKTLKIISKDYDFSNIPRNDYRKFSEEQVRYICTCFQNNPEMKYKDIISGLGYDLNSISEEKLSNFLQTISTIKRRVSYIEISKDYKF